MTNNTSSRIVECSPLTKVLICLVLIATASLVLTGILRNTDQPATAPVPAQTTPTGATTDLEGEIWWTTTDCPEGVEVPCLDPTADPTKLPAEVAAQLEQLVSAEWVCLDLVGEPADGGVYVDDEQLQQCRQYAYLTTSGETGTRPV